MRYKREMPLTKREQDIYAFILGYIVDNGWSPTRQEIADNFKFSPTASQKFLDALSDKGKIRLLKGEGKRINRNIVLINKLGKKI